MKILQRLSFCLYSSKRWHFVWKTLAFQAVKGIAKLALPLRQHLKCEIFCFSWATQPEFQKDGFSNARFHASSIVSSG